jgi:PhnB protein
MATSAQRPNPVPEGRHTVTPFVIVKGAAQFIDFLKAAFAAKEIEGSRVTGDDGLIGHAEVTMGDSVVMMFDSKPDWPETPAFLRLYVEDCDALYVQSLKAGATSVTKPTDMPWGDRVARARDPFGNLWWIMTRMEELDEAEMTKRAGEKKYIDAMQYVEGAEFFPSARK